jgi:hypothetical protein
MSLSFASKTVSADEFRERRADGVRAGNPAWLWPEVSVASWADAVAHVSNAASVVLAGNHGKLPSCDARALSLACFTSGMGPLLGWWAEQQLVSGPQQTRELLALHLREARARSKVTERNARAVISELAALVLPVMVLKGGHTARAYFPEAATRPASDLDLLVPAQAADEAGRALGEAGLVRVGSNDRESSWAPAGTGADPRHLWLVGPDDPWSVDLHRSLDFAASPGARIVRFDSADPFASCQPSALHKSARALRQPLLLLHLAVHASGGLHSLTLLRMVEIILVVRRDIADGQLSWTEFLEVGAEIGGLGAAYPALAMSEKLATGTIPTSVLAITRELAAERVRKIVERHDPANVQRIDRASIAEHFMWVEGAAGWTRQLWADLKAGSGSAESRWSIYKSRAYRLLRGSITR